MMKIPMHKVEMKHKELMPESHWFDVSTMRFFQSRLPNFGYMKNDDIFFITSEKDFSRDRRYSIRKMSQDGDIDTVGEFYQYSKAEAKRILAYNILNCKIKDL